MAELVKNFQLGKMNKDVDERLVPKGEYKDALNIEVGTAEGGNMGVIQNIKGNTELSNISPFTPWDDSKYINALTNPVCVGSISDTQTEKIYWFIASNEASVIAEYDQTTGLIQPIIVDTKSILEFKLDYYITGINILEGQLIWTDNQTEPKLILIEDWVGSTPSFTQHSTKFGRDLKESDITVIRKRPLNRLHVTPYPSARYGPGTGVTPFLVIDPDNFNFEETNAAGNIEHFTHPSFGEDGEIRTLNIEAPDFPNNYKVGDIVHLVAENEAEPDTENTDSTSEFIKYTIVIEIVGEANVAGEINCDANTPYLKYKLLTIPDEIPWETFDENGDPKQLEWKGILFEENILFEDVFPRFSYRWKYDNNQYSGYAPFTDVIFIGGEFEYLSSDGHNVGMENHIRRIEIGDVDNPIDWGDEWVKEVEILYKPSHANAVYIVDEIKVNEQGDRPTTFTIDTEIVGATVEANQLLRPFDNVPRRALAQEIGSNRIIYGNYTQQFDLIDPVVKLALEITDHPSQFAGGEDYKRMPYESLKSMRTYQVGVNYLDEYGRETPVFTTLGASRYVAIDNASKLAHLRPSLGNSEPPEWATHYKYWVKETSNEYYNLALDRFYDAEDGNIWLSFPSSEVNKLVQGRYIILKKEHDSDLPIIPKARFKIIDIQNEVPDFVATTEFIIVDDTVEICHINGQSLHLPVNPPGVGKLQFMFEGPKFDDTPKFHGAFETGMYVRFEGGGYVSEEYRITSGGPTGTDSGAPYNASDQNLSLYEISLDRVMGNDCQFLQDLADSSWNNNTAGPGGTPSTYEITVFEKKIEKKVEFTGRFFVKINRTPAFDTHVRDVFNESYPYGILDEFNILEYVKNKGTTSSTAGHAGFGWKESNQAWDGKDWWKAGKTGELVYPDTGAEYMSLMVARYHPKGDHNSTAIADTNISQYLLLKDGVELRFIDINGKESQIYKMSNTYKEAGKRANKPTSAIFLSSGESSNYYAMFGGYFDKPMESGMATIDKVQIMKKIVPPGNKILASSNPAIFETEPKEAIDIDIYFQASDALPIETMSGPVILDWFNCYSYGNGVESNRIRDDYNEYTIDKNPIANAPLPIPYEKEVKGSSLIFSQLYNNNSAHNGLNQFIQAEPITKDINPVYGSIQKLALYDTNLYTLCEDKCFNILANKDAIYNADGNTQLTSNHSVLGQTIAFSGEFGISKNPESFAAYGFRRYFTDKSRGVVIRLSKDGITLISGQGMSDFFSDNLKHNKKLIGSYNEYKAEYNLSLEALDPVWEEKLAVGVRDRSNVLYDCEDKVTSYPTTQTTISYQESAKGWASRKTYIQENGISLNNVYYTFKDALLWEHGLNEEYNNFYGIGINTPDIGRYYESSFDAMFNDYQDSIKGFKTLSYTGTEPLNYHYQIDGTGKNYSIEEIKEDTLDPVTVTTTPGWYAQHILTDLQEGDVKEFITKEGNKHFNHIKGHGTYFNDNCDTNLDSREFSVQGIGKITDMTGDIEQTLFKVTVCPIIDDSEGFTAECVTVSDLANGDPLPLVEITVKPKDGYTIYSGDIQMPAGQANMYINYANFPNLSQTQDGDNVVLSIQLQGNIAAEDLLININLVNDIQPRVVTVSGSVYEQFAGPMTPVGDAGIIVDFPNIVGGAEVPYSVSGEPGELVNAFTYTLEADAGNKFVWGPILTYTNGLPDNYSITKDSTYTESGEELLKVIITVDVTIPEFDTVDNTWNLKAIADAGWFDENDDTVLDEVVIITPTDPVVPSEHRLLAPTVTGLNENLIAVLREGPELSKTIEVGTVGAIYGYGTIYGDLMGGTQLTLTATGQSKETFLTPEISDFEIKSGANVFDTVTGNQATFVWSAFLNSPVTETSQMIWNIHVTNADPPGGGSGGGIQ